MKGWDFQRSLDPASGTPLFLQLVHAIALEIRDGRLQPGARLPS